MATIEKRTGQDGKIVYRVRVRRKGSALLTATFSTLSEAKKWSSMTEGAVLEGRHFQKQGDKKYSLRELLDRYEREILSQKGATTIRTQRLQLQWWKERLSHYALSEVTPALIGECRDRLGQQRSPGTVNRYLALLSHVFSTVVKEWGLLESNPFTRVRKVKEPRGRVRYLAEWERHALLEACKASRNKHLYTVVVIALSTGARRGEILNLRWANIDIKRQVMTLEQTKNGERRTIPLAGHALELIEEGVYK